MDLLLLVARLILAAVFCVAGLAKLVNRRSAVQSLGEFGVPTVLVAPLALALPLVELAVAIALVPVATAWWGAVAALGLLLVFLAAIGVNLARGRRPECRCFGQMGSGPIGWQTVTRNLGLSALAGLLVWQGPTTIGPSAVAWIGGVSFIEGLGLGLGAAAIVLLVAEAWLVVQLWALCGRLLLRIEALERSLADGTVASAPTPAEPDVPRQGLPIGTPAPPFALPGVFGETLTLEALRAAGKPVLLLFTDPHCGPCNQLMPDIGRWQREHAATLTIASISRGAVEANRAKVAQHGLGTALLQQDYEVANAYQAHGTPGAVLVRPDGTIGSPVALGPNAIRALVASATGGSAGPPTPMAVLAPPLPHSHHGSHANGQARDQHAVASTVPRGPILGQQAPSLRLPGLDGRTVDLADLRGSKTLVLFWNPGCGFCQRLLPDLQAWEVNRPTSAPKLLVVSGGTAEENRAIGLKSPVVLDQGFTMGTAFGAHGTPSAVLVDEAGTIASRLAVGAPQVLALASG